MINETMREKIEPRMTALFDEVRKSYGAERCGFPFLPIVRDSFVDGPRVMVCGKGGGSWGLHHAGIEGIGPHTTLADVPERDWYPEVLKVHHAFVENGAKRFLSGQEGGYSRGAWLRSLYMVMVHALLGREIGERWDRSLRNPEDAEYFYANVAFTNLDKVAREKNNLDPELRRIHDKYYTIAEEIEVLDPCFVWFPTGPGYDRHLEKALPQISFEDLGRGIEEVKGLGCLAIRTYHPQYTKVFKAADFARHLRDRLRQEGCLT